MIVDGTAPNAFATLEAHGAAPVGINFGMLDLIGDDLHEVAAVLGHELAHLKLGHVQKSAARERTSSILGTLGQLAMSAPGGSLLSDMTVNAMAAARLHERLFKQTGSSGISFLSSHPSGPERIATLKALAKRLQRE